MRKEAFMSKTYIPAGYSSRLTMYQTQTAIGTLKRIFEDKLSAALNLKRVSAPLFVDNGSGLNDDLNGVERAVSFDIKEDGEYASVVHSLAKWKRTALARYGFSVGEGLYTDMNAIRRDEEMDNLHSIYVDQWDWERVMSEDQRNMAYLKDTVNAIVAAICDTEDEIIAAYPTLTKKLSRDVFFITSQELEDLYPDLTPKEREIRIVKEKKTVFLMQIGGKLKSGIRHDGRAPDYDDWSLNGDILFYDALLDTALEISSMGIRVSPQVLDAQLSLAGCNDRRNLPFHADLLAGKLPFTIGGGIGQSRLCMLLLEKAHVGEVQVSHWDAKTRAACQAGGVVLL